ncbi:histidine phosphatase family protein [Oerskovia sp. M15]
MEPDRSAHRHERHPLTPHGEDQARAAGAALAGRSFALALHSPLVRAKRTAELAGFPDAVADPHLAEWDYGPVEGGQPTT